MDRKTKGLTLSVVALIIFVPILTTPVNANEKGDCGCHPEKPRNPELNLEMIGSEFMEIDSGAVTKIMTTSGDTYYVSSTFDEITQTGLFSIIDVDDGGRVFTFNPWLYACAYHCVIKAYEGAWWLRWICGGLCSACLATVYSGPLAWPFIPWICTACGCCLGGSYMGCLAACFTGGYQPGSGSGDISCFLAGTQVTMADGTHKNIEDVLVGEIVKAYDIETGALVDASVTEVFHHSAEEMGEYYLIINERLKVTPNHPMYFNGEWEAAAFIEPSAILSTVNGDELVYSIEEVYEQVSTYDIEVAGYPHFIADDIVVPSKIDLFLYFMELYKPTQHVDSVSTEAEAQSSEAAGDVSGVTGTSGVSGGGVL